MKQKLIIAVATMVALGFIQPVRCHALVNIDYVTVGNPGNAADTLFSSGGPFGAVSYVFAIAKYKVTNAQYTEFLNTVDAGGDNTLSLYNSMMSSNTQGGINFDFGTAAGAKYSVKSGYENLPVVFVSFYDAMRFANWLGNGQGAGSTETGAYTLSLGGDAPRNSGATVWIPSENEWYKAAYYQPSSAGGDADDYWSYPTASNVIPNSRPPNGTDANSANFYRDDGSPDDFLNDGYAKTGSTSFDGSLSYETDVGTYTLAHSYYGTFDQGGNVYEWNEGAFSGFRGVRGGAWSTTYEIMGAPSRGDGEASAENVIMGFRVAAVPLELTAAVSRKMHGGAGTFDVNLPLTGAPGVECRSSAGAHSLVFTFSNNVTSGSASVTTGMGSVSGSPTFAGKTMTVNLTGVTDVQKITVTLSGVTDIFARVLPDTAVSVNMLIGDTTGNKTVNSSDIAQTKGQSGLAVTSTNFREDVTVTGSINSSDISLVKSRSGMGVP